MQHCWMSAVSYTHLDVYKRQALIQRVVFSDRNTENVKEYKLPHNFKIGSTTEQDVIKALGTPYEYRICLLYTSRCV